MPTTSYWLETAPQRKAGPPVGELGHVDVLVIGGGVTGCSCALALAQAGATVRLHDQGRIGGGASGRNGGFALRGAAVPYDVAVASIGGDAARRLMALTEDGLGRMASLAGDALVRNGSLRLAHGEEELRRIQAEHEALRADGFAVEWLERLDDPLDGLYAGAILHPGDGALHPGLWLARLADAARAAGAVLVEDTPIAVEDALRQATAVVVATDGYTAAVLPELREVVRPTRGQVLATAPLEQQRYTQPHYARDGYDYWQQLPDGRLVLGGSRDAAVASEWTADDATSPAVQTRLDALLAALVPEGAPVTHRWSGAWGTTPDGLPLVGQVRSRERVWIAAGYSGHGNVLGLVCGELVAAAIGGAAAPELALFDPARFG